MGKAPGHLESQRKGAGAPTSLHPLPPHSCRPAGPEGWEGGLASCAVPRVTLGHPRPTVGVDTPRPGGFSRSSHEPALAVPTPAVPLAGTLSTCPIF